MIRRLPRGITPEAAQDPRLELFKDDRIRIFYAPFDFINPDAQLAPPTNQEDPMTDVAAPNERDP